MTSLHASRAACWRAWLLVLCICGAAGAPVDVSAAAAKAGTQAPGFYRMTVGDVE